MQSAGRQGDDNMCIVLGMLYSFGIRCLCQTFFCLVLDLRPLCDESFLGGSFSLTMMSLLSLKQLFFFLHKKQRVLWAQKWFDTLTDLKKPVAFLDEKWFYTTNCRRRLKLLPKTNGETDIPEYQQIHLHQFPVKVSFQCC